METIYPQFLQFIRQHNLILPKDTIILGFSGGKDSVTLFHLLKELQKDIPHHLILAYFNHRIRTDASEEEKWITQFAQSHNTERVIGSKNILEFKDKEKLNLEHAASISRYQFFKEVSSRYPNAKVATAHTKSDLTETFFIKLFRGSGLQGLGAIYHKKENTIIRPLLLFPQDAILAFIERNNLPYYQDYTNEQDEFLRNRIRRHVVPEIEKIDPDVHNHVFRTVSIIQEEYDYFSQTALDILNRHLILGKILPTAIFNGHHKSIQRHIVREYIRLIKGNLLNIDFRHIEEIRTRHNQMQGLAIPGIQLKFHKGFIFPDDMTLPDYEYPLPAPGTFKIHEIGKTLTIRSVKTYKKPADNDTIIIPAQSLKFPLTLRPPQRTDKYRKINTHINQKVFEMIRTSGIPSELRNLCPVLVNGDGRIAWTVGSPVADDFKIENDNIQGLIKISSR